MKTKKEAKAQEEKTAELVALITYIVILVVFIGMMTWRVYKGDI